MRTRVSLAVIVLAGLSALNAAAQAGSSSTEIAHYRVDASRSTFMVHADRTGIGYFKGHSHRIAVREFQGEASLTPDLLNPASLQMTIQASSLEETDPEFTPEQKAIIKKELNEIVLETAKYPEITFKSTEVKGGFKNGVFDIKITGDLTLHGVTRRITIPATVTLSGNTLHAKGEFDLNRKKYGVNATNAFHGFVRVKHDLKFVFDIAANKF